MSEALDSLEEAKKVLEAAKKLVAKNQLEAAHDIVFELTKKSYKIFHDEVIQKKQQFAQLEKDERTGIISRTDFNLTLNQISHYFLKTIGEIEKEINDDIEIIKIRNKKVVKDHKPETVIESPPENAIYVSMALPVKVKLVGVPKNFYFEDLEEHLKAKRWQEANQETIRLLKVYSRDESVLLKEKHFLNIPDNLFIHIDRLWRQNSDDKFGFSIQFEIWEHIGLEFNSTNLKELAEIVGWKKEGTNGEWIEKYEDINFSENAPDGHLPILRLQDQNSHTWWEAWKDSIKYAMNKSTKCFNQ